MNQLATQQITPTTLASLTEADLIANIREAGAKSDYHYQHSVAYAIVQGVFLAHAKESIVHGNFQKWIKESIPEISYTTANRNRKLAEGIRDHLKSSARATFGPEDILSLPLLDAERRNEVLKSIERIEDVTDGKSLRQLYFDFEVCKKPDPKGGARVKAAEPSGDDPRQQEPTPEQIRGAAQQEWKIVGESVSEIHSRNLYAHLAPAQKQALLDILYTITTAIEESID